MLQLSVHSLPAAGASAVQRTRLGRLKMLLIWAVCAAPVVASYLSYYVIKPQGRTNHGTLITPPKPMTAEAGLSFTNLQGQAVTPQALQGQWLLVSVAGGACDAACERQLYLQRQLREALGRDKDRVDRVWLIPDQAEVRPALLPALAQAWTLRVDASRLSQWLQPDVGQTLSSHLYLVDPRGDWMMRFPADADPARVKKDLMRLLKANESWDEAGR
jgi:cytochrome oxidase Cu insertion factor (SCO1/SenC/PrrC family)